MQAPSQWDWVRPRLQRVGGQESGVGGAAFGGGGRGRSGEEVFQGRGFTAEAEEPTGGKSKALLVANRWKVRGTPRVVRPFPDLPRGACRRPRDLTSGHHRQNFPW